MANRKGKWYSVIQQLLTQGAKVDFGKEPDYQAKVDLLKDKIYADEPRTAAYYAAQYAQLRVELKNLNDKVKDVNLGIAAYFQLMYNAYEAEGIHMIHFQEGGSVSIQEEPKLKVTDKEKFRLWCVANGFEHQLQLHWSTANSLLKSLLKEGDNAPDGTEAVPSPKPVYRRPGGSTDIDEE